MTKVNRVSDPPTIDAELDALTAVEDAAVVREAHAHLQPFADTAPAGIALFRELVTREQPLIGRIRACQKRLLGLAQPGDLLATNFARHATHLLGMQEAADAAEAALARIPRLTRAQCWRSAYDKAVHRQTAPVAAIRDQLAAVSASRADLEERIAFLRDLTGQMEGWIRGQNALGPATMTRPPVPDTTDEPILTWPMMHQKYPVR